QHRHLKRGAHGNGGFAWFQVNLDTVLLGELLEARAELIEGITFPGKVDTTTQADPLNLLEKIAETLLDLPQHAVEQGEITVLAVVVDHEAGNLIDHLLHFLRVPFTETAEGPRRVSDQPIGAADLRIESQAAGVIGRSIGK